MATVDRDPRAVARFPMPRRDPFEPPPEYREMRRTGPLSYVTAPSGTRMWLVTRHAEARQVLSHPKVSTNTSRPDFPSLRPVGRAPTPEERAELDKARQGWIIDMDPPEHGVYRRMLISEFSVRRINALRPGIQRVVDELVDEMLRQGPPVDLVEMFGLPVPSLVICQMLGVPYEEHEYFQTRTAQILTMSHDPNASKAVSLEIRSYLSDLVSRAEREPGDNLIGRLVKEYVHPGALSHDALVGMAQLLLMAGHETTSNQIPLGVLTLLEHPEQLARMCADPALVPGAVEELLRYNSIADWVAFDRMACEDIEIGGELIRAGEGIFVLGASANRDERAFDDPDTFDIHRAARHHVAFGDGVHQCLGQNMARAELEIAYETLFRRIPGLRLVDDVDEIPFKFTSAIFGPYELEVTW
jgi:cytochrome P450